MSRGKIGTKEKLRGLLGPTVVVAMITMMASAIPVEADPLGDGLIPVGVEGDTSSDSCVIVSAPPESSLLVGTIGGCQQITQTIQSAGSKYSLGMLFQHIIYNGKYLHYWGAVPCDQTYYYLNSMPSGWNDRVSSVDSHSCNMTILYEHINGGGDVRYCTPDCNDLRNGNPPFNDKTSSVIWQG